MLIWWFLLLYGVSADSLVDRCIGFLRKWPSFGRTSTCYNLDIPGVDNQSSIAQHRSYVEAMLKNREKITKLTSCLETKAFINKMPSLDFSEVDSKRPQTVNDSQVLNFIEVPSLFSSLVQRMSSEIVNDEDSLKCLASSLSAAGILMYRLRKDILADSFLNMSVVWNDFIVGLHRVSLRTDGSSGTKLVRGKFVSFLLYSTQFSADFIPTNAMTMPGISSWDDVVKYKDFVSQLEKIRIMMERNLADLTGAAQDYIHPLPLELASIRNMTWPVLVTVNDILKFVEFPQYFNLLSRRLSNPNLPELVHFGAHFSCINSVVRFAPTEWYRDLANYGMFIDFLKSTINDGKFGLVQSLPHRDHLLWPVIMAGALMAQSDLSLDLVPQSALDMPGIRSLRDAAENFQYVLTVDVLHSYMSAVIDGSSLERHFSPFGLTRCVHPPGVNESQVLKYLRFPEYLTEITNRLNDGGRNLHPLDGLESVRQFIYYSPASMSDLSLSDNITLIFTDFVNAVKQTATSESLSWLRKSARKLFNELCHRYDVLPAVTEWTVLPDEPPQEMPAEKLQLYINRDEFWLSSMSQIRRALPENMRSGLKVTFLSEEGSDGGGLAREWFSQFSNEMLVSNGLFVEDADADGLLINPLAKDMVDNYRTFGRILGMAYRFNFQMNVTLCSSVLTGVLGLPANLDDVSAQEGEMASRSLATLTTPEGRATIDDMHLSFSVYVVDVGEMDLKEGGSSFTVNSSNVDEYLSLRIPFRTRTLVQSQLDALHSGFSDVVYSHEKPKSVKELSNRVNGGSFIDVGDWERNTVYVLPYNNESQIIVWFWEILKTEEIFSQTLLQKLLKFVRGSSLVPIEGFRGMSNKFTIQHVDGHNATLPVAHTCGFVLDLVEYSTKETLQARLLKAIEFAEGFGLQL